MLGCHINDKIFHTNAGYSFKLIHTSTFSFFGYIYSDIKDKLSCRITKRYMENKSKPETWRTE